MFKKEIYIQRRAQLKQKMGSGLLLFFGNNESPSNYPANTYYFRQDSSFLYYFGQKRDGLVGVIDVDNDQEYLIGNDIDIEDIVWFGFVPSVQELAEQVGVKKSAPMVELQNIVARARQGGQQIHYTPVTHDDLKIQISDLLGIHPLKVRQEASVTLIKAIVDMRAVKQPEEIEQLWQVSEIGYKMHTTAMKMCRPGVTEREIAAQVQAIASAMGDRESFPTILSQHGEIAHGYPKHVPLEEGRLLLCDAGAENLENYCSDHTRVTPVSGRFTQQQAEIYRAVEAAHDWVLENARPGVKWYDMHMGAARVITEHLQQIGLMKGNIDDSLREGAHAMFFTHGLGHMMGLDVHDMEDLGQIYVGFDDEVRPSTQFGTNCLRCGRRLQEGFVMTDEPGVYFIPHLIDEWKSKGLHRDFINYDALDAYRDFGGVRIEDDILITSEGCQLIGDNLIPWHLEDVESFKNQ